MSKTVVISELMQTCGVKFGTSGARGLVSDMTDEVCYAYTIGFIQYLEQVGTLSSDGEKVVIAGDLRPSTDRIMAAVGKACEDKGYVPVDCGKIPSPAIALYGIKQKCPAVMVTGSHIPDDRNGIKYNKPEGEVLKDDEAGMMGQSVELPDIFDDSGMLKDPYEIEMSDDGARQAYLGRWVECLPSDFLEGKKIGLYQHSAVGRDILYDIYKALGAEVDKLGRSDTFLPVDTEAIRPEDVELARQWAEEGGYDAVVSTDGDSDRPLVSDENGKWLRGDVAGILCAEFLGADSVVTPVSCNTAAEKCGLFDEVKRTRIGSPYVVAGMIASSEAGAKCVVGYEANGGFLMNSDVEVEGNTLEALPTRDAAIIHLGIIGLSIRKGVKISELLASMPQRVTASDRLKEFPTEISKAKIAELAAGGKETIEGILGAFGTVKDVNETDGLRITFESEEVVHLRPSGNAPELRCYTEADSEARAVEINAEVMDILSAWRS
ncbi:phosphomannomutase [bacterium E08(2017)]|nr:phosphomannomutase [bacterium E08(2017)]